MVFYFAAIVALISNTVAFVVIKDPTNKQISTEFSALFVSEWGIQIIGVSQSLQALELVFLMRSVTSGIAESYNREHFIRKRTIINICLIMLSLVIVLVPISYIVRSHIIYVEDNEDFNTLFKDSRFLDLQITFQWFSVSVNLAITINLIIMTCMAIKTLRSFFANAFASNIR